MLVKFGGGVLAASGKLGGQVYARNRYGNYVRSLTKPVNPNSSRQQEARSNLASLVERWRDILTSDQRAAWNVYAAAISWVNQLGESITLSGFNHYVRSNAALLAAGGAVVDDGPTELTLPAADPVFACEADETGQEITVTYDDTLPWCDLDNAFMTVYMSIPKGEGVAFVGGPFRQAGAIAGSSVSPPTSTGTIAVPFPVATGHVIVCKGRILLPDGRVSQFFQHTSSVVAGS